MKKVDAGKRNIGGYAAMVASYSAAVPMISGALMQLFLADKGLSTVQVGTFATVVQLSTLIGTMVFSKVAEKSGDPRRSTAILLVLQTLLSLCYLPLNALKLPAIWLLLVAALLAGAFTVMGAMKGVLDYKLPYQLIPLEMYSNMVFFNSAINGVVGIAASFCFSRIIAVELMGKPYLCCMVLASMLLLLSWLSCSRMKPIADASTMIRRHSMSTRQLLEMFRSPKFKAIILPTLLRGVTFGITGSMVLVMLNLGYSEADASRLPIVTACGSLLAAGLHTLLSHCKVRMPNIGTIGSLLLVAVLFLPRGNAMLFYILYLLVYTGQVLVDCIVPVMVIHIVDPQIAGAYNAWRNVLQYLVATASTYVTAVLLEKGLVWILLVACVLGYTIGMAMYKKMYNRFADASR